MLELQPRILIALATYNERENLAPLVREIRRTVPTAEVLVMDDHSPDGTGKLADEIAAADPKVHVIHRPGKLGLGTALLAIMRHAMERDFEYLITMDADFSHQPRYLPALLAGMDTADVMIGSRYVPGGGVENWPWSRQQMSRWTGRLVRAMLHMSVQDSSGNYRCYRVALLRRANLENFLSQGYSFQQEALYRCHLAGARFRETPIIFTERRAGRSKATLAEMTRSLTTLFRLGWRACCQKDSIMPTPPPAKAPTRNAA